MGRIHLLSDELIDKIAAGEVVERPASVVKELAENSVDAGAAQVRVELAGGGLTSITVIDDGVGMSRADAALALERHATSKLRDEAGLFHILTKGFRGEALPSIASVSRFAITTAEADAQVGTRIAVEGGRRGPVEDAAPVPGTRITVEELFFNTPARRKFLKRESTELGHCEEALVRLALAHPEVGFSLTHEGRRLFHSAPTGARPEERVIAALGPAVAAHLLAVEERRLDVKVTGFVASPEFTLPNARGLYTFVNRRYVRDRGLIAAVQRAFHDSLPPGRQPVTVLHLELEPGAVDVNVHPQKLEVRFADPRGVQEALIAAVSRALKAAPWRQHPSQPVASEAGAQYALAVDRFLARAAAPSAFAAEGPPGGDFAGRPGFGTAQPGLDQAPPPGYFAALRFLGDLHRRFWVCEAPGGTLVVLDPAAAYERVVRRQLGEGAQEGGGLFASRVELSAQEVEAALAEAEALARLGVEVERFGAGTLAVRRVPGPLAGADLAALLRELPPLLRDAAAGEGAALRAMAARAADAYQPGFTHDEVRRILGQLDGVDHALATRRGKVVLHQVPLLVLEAAGR